MEKGEINLLAQLLESMREGTIKLEKAYKQKDAAKLSEIKKEILRIQKEIDRLL